MDTVVEMNKDGRVTIPIGFRREIDMENGGKLTLRQEDGVLKILTQQQLLEDARAAVNEFVPVGVSLVDELLAERQREAEKEACEATSRDESSA
ncbi:MAG: hypothetical protein F6K00_30130 [Leptolyngbya sp. SIOISBB]|nr:hypothetical protein [Leptolyngbya sp. SIOISBB]